MRYKFLKHTADIKFQAFGKSLEEVFESAAYALANIISKDKIKNRIKEEVSMQIKGADKERLLCDFLEEFLFLFETKGFLLSSIKNLNIEEKSGAYFLKGDVFGDKADDYELDNHVKAITYNEMFVKQVGDKFICQVVVDV